MHITPGEGGGRGGGKVSVASITIHPTSANDRFHNKNNSSHSQTYIYEEKDVEQNEVVGGLVCVHPYRCKCIREV